MTPEILNLILSLCLGAKDPQACHQNYFACVRNQGNLLKVARESCSHMDRKSKAFEECSLKTYTLDKSPHQVLADCK